MKEENVEKIEYLSYEQLPQPLPENVSQAAISMGFQSKEWFIQFQTITRLRQTSRHYGSIFLNELLPLNYKQVLQQIDNLRSNNSKEALTLVSEIFLYHRLSDIKSDIVADLVAAMLIKSVSEKGFLKSEALRGLNHLPNQWNEGALEVLCNQTQAMNANISELSIRLLSEMVQNNKEFEANGKFLKSLSHNLNGKRSVVQKRAKQILQRLKEREGEQTLEKKINSSAELQQEQSNTLRRQLKAKDEKPKGPSFKEFLKMKKSES